MYTNNRCAKSYKMVYNYYTCNKLAVMSTVHFLAGTNHVEKYKQLSQAHLALPFSIFNFPLNLTGCVCVCVCVCVFPVLQYSNTRH